MDVENRKDSSSKVPHKKDDNDLAEEDLALKQQLELYVERAQDSDPGLQRVALESMRLEIRSSTSSMTSVPKPLKFLRPHYGTLKAYYDTMEDEELKILLADILSVLALTMATEDERESLKYRLLGSEGDIGSWGHEYVRNLAAEIGHEYARRMDEEDYYTNDLTKLAVKIGAFHMKHNAEPEAVDLLMEVEAIDLLIPGRCRCRLCVNGYKRACLYLTAVAKYLVSPDNLLNIAFNIYVKLKEFSRALQIALSSDKMGMRIERIFKECDDLLQKQQVCYILARHGVAFVLDDYMVVDDDDRELLQDIINNLKLSEGFLAVARDIDVMEAKSPEDVYKAHLLDGRASARATINSARQNLAATFVNAFVNAGFGQDKLMTGVAEASSGGSSGNWLFKHKEDGKISAAASLGMILLWDVDAALAQIDKYLDISDIHFIAGLLLGVGIVHCGINHDLDPALALLGDYVSKEDPAIITHAILGIPYTSMQNKQITKDPAIRICAIMGLGIAYANTQNKQIQRRFTNVLQDPDAPLDVIAFTCISLGLVFVGSGNKNIAQEIIDGLADRNESDLGEPLARLIPLGLGLLYLGKQECVEVTEEFVKDFDEKIRKHCDMILLSCAYAGTGNVLKVQTLLGECAQHLEKGETHQGPAVLGVAMVAMAEELGLDMAIRSLEHLLQYGEQNIRRAVPLALGLLCISNPKVIVMDTLSRLSHDSDTEVAMVVKTYSNAFLTVSWLWYCVMHLPVIYLFIFMFTF